MSFFASIDDILNDFAVSRNAKINELKSGYNIGGIPVPDSKIDDRRILWEDGEIGKAILIQPNFDSKDLSIKSWNLQILAWKLNVKQAQGIRLSGIK